MTPGRAISGVCFCVMACLSMTILLSCETASQEPAARSVSAASSTPAVVLPLNATVKFDDLSPKVARPLSKPYPRRLPAGAVKAMTEARELQKKKNNAAAVEKLQRALDFDPDNPQIRQMLGMAQLTIPNYGDALKNLLAADEYLADDVQLQILLGQLYRNLRQPSQAILRYRQALLCSNAKPSNPQAAYALLVLSTLLENEGYWTAALDCLNTLQGWISEHQRAYESNALLQSLIFSPEKLKAMRGHLLALLQRNTEAIPLLTNAYQRNLADAQTADWLFEALVQDKQYPRAEDMLVELAGSGPLQGLAPLLAKELCVSSGDPAMPLRLWKRLRTGENLSAPLAMNLAQLAQQQNQPAQAMKILDDLLKQSPHHPEGVQMLAELSMRTGDRTRALKLLASLIQANPQSPAAVAAGVKAVAKENTDPNLLEQFSEATYQDASEGKFALHYVAGLLAMEQDKPLKAADHFQRAIREKKDFYPAYDALLDLHLRAKDTQALKVLLDLCKEVAEEEYYYNYLLGRAQLSEGKPDQAIDSLESARQKNNSHIPTLTTLAKAYRMQADRSQDADVRSMFVKQAQNALLQVIRLTPDSADSYRALFDLYLESGEPDRALEVAETLMRRQPDQPDGALMQAEGFLQAGKIEQARTVLQQLVQRFPDNPTIQLLAIQAILKRFPGVLPKPVYDQSVERLEGLLQKNPDHEKTRRFLAELLSQAVPGDYGLAAKVWADVVKQAPDDAEAAEMLAMTTLRAGRSDEALKLIRTLRDAAPESPTLRMMEVDALVLSARTDQAAELIRSWWNEDKTGLAWVMLLLDLYEEIQQYDDALKLLNEIKKTSPELMPEGIRVSRMVAFLCKAGRYDKAIKLAGKNDDPLCYAVLTDELVRAEKYDTLLSALKAARTQKKSPEQLTRLRENMLYVLGRAGRYKQAVETIDEWIEALEKAQPKPGNAATQLADWRQSAVRMLIGGGMIEQAQKRLTTYLANDPNNAELHNLQSSVFSEQGRNREAMQELKRALSLQPKDSSYQNNLAYLLAENGIDLKQAEQLIRSALQTDGPRSTTADTLAWVYYKQGRLGEAGEVLVSVLPSEDAGRPGRIRLNGGAEDIHPVIWDHAGDTFYRMGYVQRALQYWGKALEGAKKEPVPLSEIRGILKNTPAKLQAVADEKKPPVAPLGKEVESSIEKTLQEYRKQHNLPEPTTQPKKSSTQSRYMNDNDLDME